jgi:phosphohistidine phosphatase
MSRELWLLRHGKSDRDIITEDFDRPLKKRGKRAAKHMGNWMLQQDLIPDLVISSPAKRAIDTAKIVCAALGIIERDIKQDKRMYEEGIERIKSMLISTMVNVKTVLLVGHNPELEALLIDLAGAANMPGMEKLLPTAALVRLAMPEDWTNLYSGCARVISIIHPKTLSEDSR